MKILGFISDTIRANKNLIAKKVTVNNSIIEDVTLINIKRIYYFSIIAMIVNLTVIIILSINLQAGDQNEIKWRLGTIITHASLFIIMAAFGGGCFFLRKEVKSNQQMRIIQNMINVTIFISGSILAYIDQLVTTNITPFIIACITTGAIFLMRPMVATILYLSSFASFYYIIGFAQQNEVVLLSDRINGLTSMAIGFCVSMIMWVTNRSNIMQRRLIQTQQRELKQKNLKLEALAFYDLLTGLYSRRKFEELLQNEISMILRYEHESCIIILDVDRFKEINDNYGHPVGDMVIKQIAYLLKKNVRETDSVARWGGDEFLILLPYTSIMEGEQVAEKLRKMIEKKDFFLRQNGIQITSSFGVAGLKCNKNDTLELAYRNVDRALYTAKEKGRNRVETA